MDMELQQFEQAILQLAFETDARITTASVAYYLGIPSREANRLLNELLEEGALELDSDARGNLFYVVPNKPTDGDRIADLKGKLNEQPTHERGQLDAEPAGQRPRVEHPAHDRFRASIDDEGGEAYRPRTVPNTPPPHVDADPGVPAVAADEQGSTTHRARWTIVDENAHAPRRDNWGGFNDYFGRPPSPDGSSDRDPQRTRRPDSPVWAGVATRVASPDASLDRCGASPVVVSTEVRCGPRPLPASKPVVISCSDQDRPDRSTTRAQEQMWFGQTSDDTAMVQAGETALARDYIEQPEHQPGMALLLSLILCGTGQIYNGEVSKGIMMMVLCFLLWFVLLGWVVHIWSIVDAVVVAEKLNRNANPE